MVSYGKKLPLYSLVCYVLLPRVLGVKVCIIFLLIFEVDATALYWVVAFFLLYCTCLKQLL